MLEQEYRRLLSQLSGESLVDFVSQFIVYKYGGMMASCNLCSWQGGYVCTIKKDNRDIKRNVLIVDAFSDVKSCLDSAIGDISSKAETDSLFRKIELICLSEIDNQQELIDEIDIENNLSLVIYDINFLVNAVMNEKALGAYLCSNSKSSSSSLSKKNLFDPKNKILYDIFATSAKIADIKNSFLASYIQYFLLENGNLTEKEIKSYLAVPFPNLSTQAYEEAMRINRGLKQINYINGKYQLTDDYKDKLLEIKSVSSATENILLEDFDKCLKKYGIKDKPEDILNTIINLYKIQNNKELSNLRGEDVSKDNSDRMMMFGLLNKLVKNGICSDVAKKVVIEIIGIVSQSEYLNKMSTTTMFTSLFNSDELEEYLDKQKKIVVIDAMVLMQLLCIDYQDVPYDDPSYDAARTLYYQIKESRDFLDLRTTSDYIREVSNHLFEAHNLSKFLRLKYLKDLGPSKNVFYNFYLYLNANENVGFDSYDDYLCCLLGIDEPLPNDYNRFVQQVDQILVDLLEGIGIIMKPISCPQNLTDLRRDYDILLGENRKSSFARTNDINCMMYLSDKTNFINMTTGISEVPFFITTDTTLSDMREKLNTKYQRSFWFIYPPIKFANRLSVMNMKLDSRNINYDIICLAENNYSTSNETVRLIDVMTRFFDTDGIENKKLPRYLAKIRREEEEDNKSIQFKANNNDNLPIDIVLNKIHKKYRGERNVLSQVQRLFSMEIYADKLLSIIKIGCQQQIQTNKIGDNLFSEIDKLIEAISSKKYSE